MSKEKDIPQAVLFVCTLNSIRSPMAEGLMKKRFGQDVYTQSCGISTGELNQLMVTIMSEVGIDMSEHVSKSLEEVAFFEFEGSKLQTSECPLVLQKSTAYVAYLAQEQSNF